MAAMSDEEWKTCRNPNAMFNALEWASESQLSAFNLECCQRIREFISDPVSHAALAALESSSDHASIPAELAHRANEVGISSAEFCEPRNFSAAKAVARAVCRCLPLGSFWYCKDPVENSREVALYCQWAAETAATPSDEDESRDEHSAGLNWLRDRARIAEEIAQCDLIRKHFTRRIEPVGTD